MRSRIYRHKQTCCITRVYLSFTCSGGLVQIRFAQTTPACICTRTCKHQPACTAQACARMARTHPHTHAHTDTHTHTRTRTLCLATIFEISFFELNVGLVTILAEIMVKGDFLYEVWCVGSIVDPRIIT